MSLRAAVGAAFKAFGEKLDAAPVRQSLSTAMDAGYSAAFLRGEDIIAALGSDDVKLPYQQAPVIHRGVKVAADVAGCIPLEFFAGDSDEPLPPEHPVVRTFTAPTEKYSGRQLISRTVMDLMLSGNAIWYLDGMASLSARNRAKFPTYLRPLQMRGVMPARDARTGEHTGWIVMTSRGRRTYTLEETAQFFFENPYDDVMGMSEVGPTVQDMQSMHLAGLRNQRILSKGGPGVIFERSDPGAAAMFGAEGDEQFAKTWNKEFTGDDTGNAFILPPGLKPSPAGLSQKDMDFEKLMRLSRENQAGALGIPPSLLGILEYANYANMGSQLEYFFHFTVFPLCDRMQDTIQTKILDPFKTGLRCYFKKESVKALYENMEKISSVAVNLYSMRVPFEAINERLDLGIDTDEYPWLKEDPQAMAQQPPEEEPDPEDVKAVQSFTPARNERTRAAMWQKYERTFDQLTRRYLGSYRGFLNWLRDTTIRNMEMRQSVGQSDGPPTDEEIAAQLRARLQADYMAAIAAGGAAVQAELGILFAELLDSTVQAILARRSQSIKGAAQAVARKLRLAIGEGVELGETVAQLADRVRALIAEQYAGQAKTVARTETAAAYSDSRNESLKASGITRHEWLSAHDEFVRPSHAADDGKVVVMGEPFPNTRLRFPLDPSGAAGEVINCRCVALAVVEP